MPDNSMSMKTIWGLSVLAVESPMSRRARPKRHAHRIQQDRERVGGGRVIIDDQYTSG